MFRLPLMQVAVMAFMNSTLGGAATLTTSVEVIAYANGVVRSCHVDGSTDAACNAEAVFPEFPLPLPTSATGGGRASSSWGFLQTFDGTSVTGDNTVATVFTSAAFNDRMVVHLPAGGDGSLTVAFSASWWELGSVTACGQRFTTRPINATCDITFSSGVPFDFSLAVSMRDQEYSNTIDNGFGSSFARIDTLSVRDGLGNAVSY